MSGVRNSNWFEISVPLNSFLVDMTKASTSGPKLRKDMLLRMLNKYILFSNFQTLLHG